MKNVVISVATILGFSFAAPLAANADSRKVVVESAWARASVGTGRPGAAYMTILNRGDEPIVLTGLQTSIAMMSTIHESRTNESGVSSMSPAGDIVIGAGEAAFLKPGGLHAMLMKLQVPMVEGDRFSLTLTFDDGGVVDVEVPVLSLAARGPEG